MPTTRTVFCRPPLLALAAILAVLVFVGALAITPLIQEDGPDPLGFWWARVAPAAYARDYLRHTETFITWDRITVCTGPDHRLWAWHSIAVLPRADSDFAAIFANARPPGRLYALAGLAQVRGRAYQKALDAARHDSSKVWVREPIPRELWFHGPPAFMVAEDNWVRTHFGPSGFRRTTLGELVSDSAVAHWGRSLFAGFRASCAT